MITSQKAIFIIIQSKVHALKSAARNIGAIKLSEKQRNLKSREGRKHFFISKENGSLFDMYHDTVLSLSDIASYVKEKKRTGKHGTGTDI